MASSLGVPLRTPAKEPVALSGVELLQASFEVCGVRGSDLLPEGLVPTVPTLCTFLVARVGDAPWGATSWAQVRLSCRSGVRARALAVATIVDATDEGAHAVASGWGLGGERGLVRLERRYDKVRAEVPAWALEVHLADPAPIAGSDIHYVVGLHPVEWAGQARLAQVELDMVPERAERGRPVLVSYRGFGERATIPAHPVAATLVVATLTLPRVRFLLDPALPPHLGTEVL